MTALSIYLLKVSLPLAMFYGLHMLLLRGETFFVARRVYFLIAVLFSFVFPFISLPTSLSSQLVTNNIPVIELEEIIITANATATASSISPDNILEIIALAGSTLLFCKLLLQIGSITYILRSKSKQEYDNCKLIEIQDDNTFSFSFFRWIVINTSGRTEKQARDIINHELAHAQQLHSIDVLIYEVVCLLMWWNPIVWLLRKEMKLNLEYLADHRVQQEKEDIREYQYLLLEASLANTKLAITNNLNVSYLKKRITMMNKKKSKMNKAIKYLLVLPLVFGLVLFNNCTEKDGPLASATDAKTTTASDTLIKTDTIYQMVEDLPNFTGGEEKLYQFLSDNLKYPKEAEAAGIEGRVFVRFVIETDGTITDPIILKGTDPSCDKEALRVIRLMPKWEPGKINGEAVRTYFSVPLLFKLAIN